MIRMKAAKALALAAVIGAVSACSAVYRNHGYVPMDEELAQVEVGVSDRQAVATAIGRPGATGLLEGAGWYYVGSRWKHAGLYAPEEISREVVAVSFDKAGIVSNVERFGLNDGNVVVLSRRVTTENASGMTAITQLLGSLGRLNPGQMLGGGTRDPFARN